MFAIGYIRVSTGEQAAGLTAQRRAIELECERRGWPLVLTYEDAGASGASTRRRPGLASALEAVEAGDGDVLVVAKLDRLSRSTADFANLMERAKRNDWRIVVLDIGVDTTTANGEMLVSVLAALAQWERRMISERTKSALAVKRAQGVRLGRPRTMPDQVVQRIRRSRARGMTLQAIADRLNRDQVPTAQDGARWHASTVRAVLRRS